MPLADPAPSAAGQSGADTEAARRRELAPPPRAGGAPAGTPVTTPAATTVAGWGGGPRVPVKLLRAAAVDELRDAVATLATARRSPGSAARSDAALPDVKGAIARGMGRSYGDAAQLGGGLVFDMTGLRAFELDRCRGVVTTQAGATLQELLDGLGPVGWTLPVVPGTQHVSVGGAIACDIHGKNHGVAGTFGRHVQAIGLMTAAGEVIELTRASQPERFAATLGGMGLTGVILWAEVELVPLTTAWLSVDSDRVRSLDEALAVLLAPGGSHRVAWLDLLGPRLLRGIVTRAQPLIEEPGSSRAPARSTVPARLTVPARWPGWLLRPSAVRAYNEYRFRRCPEREIGSLEQFGAHMFPLDALRQWPRLYGPSGFVQYQLVVPRGAEGVLEAVIERLRNSPIPCYLAVLKDFGPDNGAPLSFPIEGWTLALDLPRSAPGLESLLLGFDDLVAEAGGRVYLAKDARLRPEMLAAMYPRLEEWKAVRDGIDPERVWRSDLALRTGLVEAR